MKKGIFIWLQAARLRTLPLSVSGIIMGAFIARWRLVQEGGFWDYRVFLLALLVTMFYQILSNFSNDYGDGTKGTDDFRDEKAESRAVASGKISAEQMKKVVISFAVLSVLGTVALLYLVFFPDFITEFWGFIGLGIMSIWAAISYTIGKKPYGYLGLGDIMVFIFFGLVSVGGSYFLFTKTWNWDILLPASAVGMLSVSVLNLNNMRDMESDQKAGKKTVAQRLGFRYAMIYQIFILVFLMKNNLHSQGKYYAFIVMILFFPMAALRRNIMKVKLPNELDPFLKQVGIITLMMVVLVALGLNYF